MYSVKISYKVCIEKTLEDSLVSLPSTISQGQSTPVQGICLADTVQIVPGNLTVLCDSDGEWNTSRLERRCVCKEDMENREGVCSGLICSKYRFVFLPSTFLDLEMLNLCCLILSHYCYLSLSRLCRLDQSRSGLTTKKKKKNGNKISKRKTLICLQKEGE